MAEFDEKLNALLSNPDAMAQIMQMAQSLGGSSQKDVPPQPPPPPKASPQSEPTFPAFGNGIDPGLLMRLLPLIQELGSQQDSNAQRLLYALRPYLREERQEKVERALQLARLFHLGKKFLAGWEGGSHL